MTAAEMIKQRMDDLEDEIRKLRWWHSSARLLLIREYYSLFDIYLREAMKEAWDSSKLKP